MNTLIKELRKEVDNEVSKNGLEYEIDILKKESIISLEKNAAKYVEKIKIDADKSITPSYISFVKELQVQKELIESYANYSFCFNTESFIRGQFSISEYTSLIYYFLITHEVDVSHAFKLFKEIFNKITEATLNKFFIYKLLNFEFNIHDSVNDEVDHYKLEIQIINDLLSKYEFSYDAILKKHKQYDELEKRNYKLVSHIDDLKDLKYENQAIHQVLENYTFQNDDLFADYMFGYDMNLYRNVYYILDKYGVLSANMTFPFFLHKIQSNCKIEDKLLLQTKDSFNAELIGYLFHHLKQYGLHMHTIDQNFDFYEWFVENVEVKMRGGKVKPLPGRYIMDIKKEEKFTPKQQDILLEIDQVFIKTIKI